MTLKINLEISEGKGLTHNFKLKQIKYIDIQTVHNENIAFFKT